MTPGLYTVYKLRALERLMDEGGFASLRVFGGDDALRRALAQMCRTGHRLYAQSCDAPTPPAPAKSLLRRLYDATPPPLRALARYAHWWWTVRRLLPQTATRQALPPVTGQAATIVTYFPNVDMDVLCTDKTGTLTQDRIVLEYSLDIHGTEDARVLRHAFLNSWFQTGLKNLLDAAIVNHADELSMEPPGLVVLCSTLPVRPTFASPPLQRRPGGYKKKGPRQKEGS